MRIAIGSDHAGYQLKEHVRTWLAERQIDVRDVGARALDPADDYPDFARAVEACGCRFIGPSPEAIALMGSKLASRTAVANAGVPVVPGSREAVTSLEQATATALEPNVPWLQS